MMDHYVLGLLEARELPPDKYTLACQLHSSPARLTING